MALRMTVLGFPWKGLLCNQHLYTKTGFDQDKSIKTTFLIVSGHADPSVEAMLVKIRVA